MDHRQKSPIAEKRNLSLRIFHNPKCSKSRATLELLRSRGLAPEIIEYLIHPPSASELSSILGMLRMQPRELMRKKEAAYQASGSGDSSLNDKALIQAMIEHPILIERPIVVSNGRAAIGRPPEAVLEIL